MSDMTRTFPPSLRRRYEAGESSVALAVEYGASPPTILKALRQMGASIRPRGTRARRSKPELLRLREKGLTYREIGERVGLSTQRVHQILSGRA